MSLLAAALAAAAGARLRAVAAGVLVAAALLAGSAFGHHRVRSIDAALPVSAAGQRLAARAVVLERPRPSRFGSSAVLGVTGGPARGARVLARATPEVRWPGGGEVGSEVRVSGLLTRPRAEPSSDFDWPAHLRRRGISLELAAGALEGTGVRRGGLAGAIDGGRRRAERALEAGLPAPRAALARGMLLGQDERIDDLRRDDFRRSGLAHLLAVSGQNIMLLGALAFPLLAAAGIGPRGRVAGVLVLIALYVPLAGAGPSLQRAGAMGAAGLVALAAGRPASRWYGLLLAAAVTLAVNPRVAGDAGWQLSFAAVVGILCLGPGLRRVLDGLPRPLAEGAAMTIAATVATAPLMAHHFGAVSLAGLPANLMALPAVAPVMWIGMLQMAAGQLAALGEPTGAVGLALAGLLGGVNDVLLAYIEWLARHFAEAPGARTGLALPDFTSVALAFAAIAGAALLLRDLARRLEPWAASGAAEWRRLPAVRRALAVAAGAAALVALWLAATGPGPAPDQLTVSFLDVGQGDATLVQHPAGGAVLFDGGPAEARVARLMKGLGVRRLSMVVLTHASADHHGGLREVLQRFPVALLLDGSDGNADPEVRAVLEEAARRGIRTVTARAGQTLRAGGLVVEILAPAPRPPGPAPEDPNPRAVVAVVSAGDFQLFLSADAETPALSALDLPDVEAMKVPHHGSADEGLPDLLHRLRPDVAAIEVGEDNSYGHPAPSTLDALRAVPRVYRTDRDGTVRLTVDEAGMRVETGG